jgi:ribosomal protein S12 methylthiotransferase
MTILLSFFPCFPASHILKCLKLSRRISKVKQIVRVGLVNLGCPKNQVDAEIMLGTLSASGFELTANENEADLLIVNTCGFIDQAKAESIDTLVELGALKETGRLKFLLAAGCLAQRYGKNLLEELPELDGVVGVGDFPKIAEVCRQLLSYKGRRPLLTDAPTFLYDEETPRVRTTPRHWAYVKVSEGCNYRCSFCAIPSFRGDLVSRPPDSVVSEVERLAGEGVREVNLIAQSLTSYGWERRDRGGLVALLRRLVRIDGVEWIRLFYTYPTDFTEPLIDLIASEEKICKYVDLPLQHIDDRILREMHRKGSAKEIRRLIDQLRGRIPDLTLRTTFIVGFPGEDEMAFQSLQSFVEEIGFDRLGVFTYSPEEGTPAFSLGDPVPNSVKAQRRDRLLKLQARLSRKRNRRMIGQRMEVRVDGPSSETDLLLEGRTQGQAPEVDGVVYISDVGSGPPPRPGDLVTLEVTAAHTYDLVGRVVERSPDRDNAVVSGRSGLRLLP